MHYDLSLPTGWKKLRYGCTVGVILDGLRDLVDLFPE